MSEEALRLIHEEKKNRTGKLDLGSTGLTEIPKEVFELVWLEWLNFQTVFKGLTFGRLVSSQSYHGSNLLKFKSIPEKIGLLKNLKSLYIGSYLDDSFNRLDDIGALLQLPALIQLSLPGQSLKSSNSTLPQLTQLQYLDLSCNQIEDLYFLNDFRNLNELRLEYNHICDLSTLRQTNQLQSLILGNNKILDIAPLSEFKKLILLRLNSNQINNLDPIRELKALRQLTLGSNRIRDLSPLLPLLKYTKIAVNPDKDSTNTKEIGHTLYINDNPIQTPPLEIVNQGREAILEWFEANRAKLNEVKLILIGEPEAGKTSLLRRLKDGSFNPKEPQTDGINIEDITFGTCPTFQEDSILKDITGHFWDFGGQEIMNSTHQFFLTNRSVYILVLNARNDKEVSNQIRKWVQRIQATGGNSSIIVVANQIDVNPGFGFENEANLKEEFPQIKGFLKVSCLDGENIQQLISLLEEWIPKAEMFETEIDERWLPIKRQLEEETKGDKNKKGRYLDEPRFHEICEAHGLDSTTSQKSLVKFLHDLGLLLHFEGIQENLSEYYVLDPYWITYGVYQILTSKYAGERKGIVPVDQLDYIVNEEPDKSQTYQPKKYEKIKYSPNQRRFLVDILHEFKLCFYVTGRQQFIIPDLLETNAPEQVTESFRKSKQALRFVYQYTYIPSSIIPQIMVEAHGMLEHIWRTGCVISLEGSRAMINAYQNQILIIVEGEPKKKREFMSIIRYLIDQINGKLSDPPKMSIPLPGFPQEFVSYKKLLSLEKRGERSYLHFSEEKDEEFEFSVSELLEGIALINKDNKLIKEVQELKFMMQAGASKLDLIYEHQIEHYAYLRTNLPPDWDERLLDELTSLQIEQTDGIRQELIEALAKAFELHQNDMDDQLKDIYLKMTEPKSLTSLKLKAGLPLLVQMVTGLNVEAEFDLKAWSERMYKKYELKLFKVMGKVT